MNDKPNYYMKLPMPLRREFDSIKQGPNESFAEYTIRYSEMMCRITEELNRQKEVERNRKEAERSKFIFKVREFINSCFSSDLVSVLGMILVFLTLLSLLVSFLW